MKIINDIKEIYDYMNKLVFPYHYKVDYDDWKMSYLNDIDGNGNNLFLSLTTIASYDNNLKGFIQYGKTAFGFDDKGNITKDIHYFVIRNFYFDEQETGNKLLQEVIKACDDNIIYAYYHYFGMSCYARHGKLFEKFDHIHNLLIDNGFNVEHENVFYSSKLGPYEINNIKIKWRDISIGKKQYGDFIDKDKIVGGCEIHYVNNDTVYLRWIFINDGMQHQGIGSKCMMALKNDLYNRNFSELDTDTALTNIIAQNYYEKNDFVKEGISRSYVMANKK